MTVEVLFLKLPPQDLQVDCQPDIIDEQSPPDDELQEPVQSHLYLP